MAQISNRALMEAFRLNEAEAQGLYTRLHLAVSDREVSEALEYASKVIGGHGVGVVGAADHRAWSTYWQDILIAFVNMGDPYRRTILYDVRKGKFAIGAWGDWVEIYESHGGSVAGFTALRRGIRRRRSRYGMQAKA